MLVDHLLCRDRRLEESLLERRAGRTVAARQNHQTALGKFLKFVQKSTLPLVENVEIDGALVAHSNACSAQGVQHHNGSQLLAAVMYRWPPFSSCGSSILPRNYPHMAVFILFLRVTHMRPSELLTLKKKALVPPLVQLLPWWSIVIAVSDIGVSTKTEVHDGSVLMDHALASMGQQALALAEVWESVGENLEFQSHCRSEIVQDGNRRFGTQRHAHVSNTSQWSQHRSSARFRNSARRAKTRSVAPLSPSPAPKRVGNTRATCRGVIDKTIPSPAVRQLMTGKSFIDVFGGSGHTVEGDKSSGSAWLRARHHVWSPVWRDADDFTSTTTHLVLFKSYLRHCFHRWLASSCPHAMDFGTPVCLVVVGCAKHRSSCCAASHGLGLSG